MAQEIKQLGRVSLNRRYVEDLEKKASFLEELLSFIEERYLGFLMEETEGEKNIPLAKARKFFK